VISSAQKSQRLASFAASLVIILPVVACSGGVDPTPIVTSSAQSPSDGAGSSVDAVVRYEIQAGDTWSSIAEAVYGDATRFQEVLNASGGRPMEPGFILELPAP
jgi:nucleoid-associated protein YgaU